MSPIATRAPLPSSHLAILADVCLRDPSLWRSPSRRPSWVPDAPALRPEVPMHYWRKDPGLWVPLSCAYARISGAAASYSLGPSNATTDAIDTTGADLIVIFATALFGLPAISDSKSNTWVPVATYGATVVASFWYAYAPTVGGSHAFVAGVGGSSGAAAIAVEAYSGATSSPLDDKNGATSDAATDLQTGSVSPSQNDELLVSGLAYNESVTPSIDSSFTIRQGSAPIAGVSFGVSLADLIQTSAGAVNPQWSVTATSFMTVATTTFKAAGGGGGPRRFFLY